MSLTVMVTGVSSGIGLAVAKRLLSDSYSVVGISRRHIEKPVESTGRFFHENIDLSDLNGLKDYLPMLVERYLDVDAIVFCAGYGRFGGLEEFSYDQMTDLVNTNLVSTMFLTRAVLPQMKRRQRGRLIFIGSESVLSGGRRGAVYTATKSALHGFARSLRRECASDGIHIGLITSGMAKTEFYDRAQFTHGDSPDNYVLPEDVAQAVSVMLESRQGTVIDEVQITPLKSVIRRRQTS